MTSPLEPKFLNEYMSQFLFDVGQITPMHLQSMRVGLMAYYKRIKYINIEADLNQCILNVSVKFRWWYILLPKEYFLKKIKGLFERSLPKQYRMVEVEKSQPALEQVDFQINIGHLKSGDQVRWVK